MFRKKYNLKWVWVELMICGKAILDIFEFLKQKFLTPFKLIYDLQLGKELKQPKLKKLWN